MTSSDIAMEGLEPATLAASAATDADRSSSKRKAEEEAGPETKKPRPGKTYPLNAKTTHSPTISSQSLSIPPLPLLSGTCERTISRVSTHLVMISCTVTANRLPYSYPVLAIRLRNKIYERYSRTWVAFSVSPITFSTNLKR